MSERVSITREVDIEAGQEHVWWTVRDHSSGYNKTFRDEAEANAHADWLNTTSGGEVSERMESLGELLHRKITDRLPANPSKAEISAYVDAAISAAVKAGYGKVTK